MYLTMCTGIIIIIILIIIIIIIIKRQKLKIIKTLFQEATHLTYLSSMRVSN